MKSIIHNMNIKKNFIYLANVSLLPTLILSSSSVFSQEKIYIAPDVNIISVTPVQGSGLSIDRVPGKVQNISREVIGKKKIFLLQRHSTEKLQVSLFLI